MFKSVYSRSAEAYTSWKNNPVMTTIETTGLSVSKVDFPAVVLCGQGAIREVFSGAFASHVLEFLKKKGCSM